MYVSTSLTERGVKCRSGYYNISLYSGPEAIAGRRKFLPSTSCCVSFAFNQTLSCLKRFAVEVMETFMHEWSEVWL